MAAPAAPKALRHAGPAISRASTMLVRKAATARKTTGVRPPAVGWASSGRVTITAEGATAATDWASTCGKASVRRLTMLPAAQLRAASRTCRYRLVVNAAATIVERAESEGKESIELSYQIGELYEHKLKEPQLAVLEED